MSAPALVGPEEVTVRAIQKRMTKSGPRWHVKWRVGQYADGRRRDKTSSFKTRSAADQFRADLLTACRGRHSSMFSAVSGLPVSWATVESSAETTSFLDLAIMLVEQRWDEWSAKNRMSRVESLAQLCVYATKAGGPDKEVLRLALRNHVLRPEGQSPALVPLRKRSGETFEVASVEQSLRWLVKNSLPLAALDSVDEVEALLNRASHSVLSGRKLSPSMRQKFRGSASLVFETAVRRKLLVVSPMPRGTRSRGSLKAVEPSRVPRPAEAREIVNALSTISVQAVTQYRALFTVMWCCGPRPSELYGLRAGQDLKLPERGWGTITLRAPLVGTSSKWTNDGAQYEQRSNLKARAEGAVRVVMVPPEAVAVLREHLDQNGVADGELVFRNSRGNPLNQSTVAKQWAKCRERALDGRFDLTFYELRHTAASVMLEARVPPARIAEQLGNSVPVIMRTYARVISTDDSAFTDAMDRAFA